VKPYKLGDVMTNQPQMQGVASGNDQLSALVDGRLNGDDFAAALRHLGSDDGAVAQWHAYHLIGDVMRSPDLADARGDMAFLKRLEARLANEPVPALAPLAYAAPVVASTLRPAANGDVFRWKIAAGFASLAAVAAISWQSLQLQSPMQAGSAAMLAQATGANVQSNGLEQVRAEITSAAEGTRSSPGNPPVMLRNPQLDELLAAHNRAVGGAALQSQVRLLRNVSVTEDFSR
jgi:sigma-E factor negative regulatory protein RseA